MTKLRSMLSWLSRKESGSLDQFIKYAIGGIVATAVHTVVFYLLGWLVFPALNSDDPFIRLTGIAVPILDDSVRGINAMINNSVAFVFSNLAAYLINIAWVFEPGRHNRIVEIAMFYAVSGVSLLIGSAMMWALINWFSLSTTVSFVAVMLVSVLINYAMRRFVIFKG